jgi:Thrombospondin type 3 repeat
VLIDNQLNACSSILSIVKGALPFYKLKGMETMKRIITVLLIIIPVAVFSQHKATSWDSDGDGIPDSVDKCMLVPGLAQFQGCPYAPNITADDRDGDGVADAYDACPDMFGLQSNKGCPSLEVIEQPASPTEANAQQEPASQTASMFTSTSSSENEEMNDFKDNLIRVLQSSGQLFADITTYKDAEANDYKTALCLAGANDCYVDFSRHFIASYGTYSNLDDAMNRFDELKQKLVMALSEDKWQGTETTDNGMKSYEMRRKDEGHLFSPRVTAFIKQMSSGDAYKVYLLVDSK